MARQRFGIGRFCKSSVDIITGGNPGCAPVIESYRLRPPLTTMTHTFANLVTDERTKSLKTAQRWLWVVGALTLVVQLYLFSQAGAEVRTNCDAELAKTGASIAEILARPAEERAEFEAALQQDINTVRLIYGAGIALGVTFLGCGFMMLRKPLAASITALSLYLASIAGMAALNPATLIQGILMKALVIIALVSAVKAALAASRDERDAAEDAGVASDLPPAA